MIFKYVYKRAGRHVHVNVFAGRALGALAKCGVLCYASEEFAQFKAIMEVGVNDSQQVIFEEQITSGPATRGNNGYRQALV